MNQTFQDMADGYKKAIDRYFDNLKPPEDAVILLHMVSVMESLTKNPGMAKQIAVAEFFQMPTIINVTMIAQFTEQLIRRLGEQIDEPDTQPPSKPRGEIDPSLN